jgi:hypothetical protein
MSPHSDDFELPEIVTDVLYVIEQMYKSADADYQNTLKTIVWDAQMSNPTHKEYFDLRQKLLNSYFYSTIGITKTDSIVNHPTIVELQKLFFAHTDYVIDSMMLMTDYAAYHAYHKNRRIQEAHEAAVMEMID